MYDILSNHRVEKVRSGGAQTPGSADQATIDLFSNGCANRALLVVDVSAVVTDGDLTIVCKDSDDNSTFDADFATLANITETGLYVAVIDDPARYLKIAATVADANVTWSAILVTFEEQRRPVTQTGTELAVTYGTGRKPKVATS